MVVVVVVAGALAAVVVVGVGGDEATSVGTVGAGGWVITAG